MKPKTMTIGELKSELSGYPDSAPIYFGDGKLSFNRIKNRGPVGGYLLNLEFNEIYEVHQDFSGPETD